MSRMIYNPPCHWCKHFDAEAYDRIPRMFLCQAFPNEIPRTVAAQEFDHRFPYPNDNGIQFEKYESWEKLPRWIRESFYPTEDLFNLMICEIEEMRLEGIAQPPINPEEMQFQETFYQMFIRIADEVKERLIQEGKLDETEK